MIAGFKDQWLQEFFELDRTCRQIPADLASRLFRKLQLLDDATCEADLKIPPGNRFEYLKGNLAGRGAIRLNERWRLIFCWDDHSGEASEVYLDDHSYR